MDIFSTKMKKLSAHCGKDMENSVVAKVFKVEVTNFLN